MKTTLVEAIRAFASDYPGSLLYDGGTTYDVDALIETLLGEPDLGDWGHSFAGVHKVDRDGFLVNPPAYLAMSAVSDEHEPDAPAPAPSSDISTFEEDAARAAVHADVRSARVEAEADEAHLVRGDINHRRPLEV